MSRIHVRRARPADELAMRWITHDIWEGTDYIPMVWSSWLNDPNGIVMVAELDGHPVGLQHVELQPDGTAWFEGIRTATPARGTGVGRALVDAGLEWARAEGSPAARMAIYSGNEASNRLAISAGFSVAAEFDRFSAQAGGQGGTGVRPALPSDEQAVWEIVCRHDVSLYGEGWTAYCLSRDRLRLLLATHAVAISENMRATGIAIATVHRPMLRIGLLAGDQAEMTEVAAWLRQCGDRTGQTTVGAILPSGNSVTAALENAGFERRPGPVLIREVTFERA